MARRMGFWLQMSANPCLTCVEIHIKMQIMTAFNFLLPIRESHFEFNDNNEDVVGKVFCF